MLAILEIAVRLLSDSIDADHDDAGARSPVKGGLELEAGRAFAWLVRGSLAPELAPHCRGADDFA